MFFFTERLRQEEEDRIRREEEAKIRAEYQEKHLAEEETLLTAERWGKQQILETRKMNASISSP